MTALFYFLNVACSAGQSTLSKSYAAKNGKANVFNISKALSGVIVFSLFAALSGFSFHTKTFLFGITYSIFLYLSMYTGFKALSLGPIALTSMIGSFSLIIPLFFGIAVWGETLSYFGIAGILLLSLAIILLNFRKEKGITFKWSVYAFSTLIANGICSIIQKYHQIFYPQKYRIEFMIFAFLSVLMITLLFSKGKTYRQNLKFCPEGIISGILNSGANYIVLYLAATENATILFPLISIANVITVFIIGKILFKEKLTPIQLSGLSLGIISILLLNL